MSELSKRVERAHSADTWITDDQSNENAQSIVLPDDVNDLDALAKVCYFIYISYLLLGGHCLGYGVSGV